MCDGAADERAESASRSLERRQRRPIVSSSVTITPCCLGLVVGGAGVDHTGISVGDLPCSSWYSGGEYGTGRVPGSTLILWDSN